MSDEQDDASRYGPMLGLLASLGGANSLALTLIDTFEIAKLTAEERKYLLGPVIIDNAGNWSGDMPRWLHEQVRHDRYEIILGSKPDWIVSPAEIVLALHDSAHRAPMRHDFFKLYMWANSHAVSRHKDITRDAYFEMVTAPGMTLMRVEDDDVLKPSGLYYHAYFDLAWDIRRKVIKHAGAVARRVRPAPREQPEPETAPAPPKAQLIDIPDAVRQVLATATIADNALVLPGQLDRKLYEQVDAVLVGLGGKWSRSRKAHLFAEDPTARLAEALASGHLVDRKRTLQHFETPAHLAADMAGIVKPGDRVLEPQAGLGRLVRAAVDRGGIVDAIDIDAANVAALRVAFPGVQVRLADFLNVPAEPTYDTILCNPPFRNDADIRHVLHAWNFLRPGGHLVAVMPAGSFHESRRRVRLDFAAWCRQVGATSVALPPRTFEAEGTSVATRLLRAQRGANA